MFSDVQQKLEAALKEKDDLAKKLSDSEFVVDDLEEDIKDLRSEIEKAEEIRKKLMSQVRDLEDKLDQAMDDVDQVENRCYDRTHDTGSQSQEKNRSSTPRINGTYWRVKTWEKYIRKGKIKSPEGESREIIRYVVFTSQRFTDRWK